MKKTLKNWLKSLKTNKKLKETMNLFLEILTSLRDTKVK